MGQNFDNSPNSSGYLPASSEVVKLRIQMKEANLRLLLTPLSDDEAAIQMDSLMERVRLRAQGCPIHGEPEQDAR